MLRSQNFTLLGTTAKQQLVLWNIS